MRTALLTGVGREGQVGEAVAARLASDGFELILVDRSPENAAERAKAIRRQGGTATSYSADLSDASAVNGLIQGMAARHFTELDAVVHMAGGFSVTGPVAETKVEDWDRQLSINLRTAFLTARALIPLLRPRRGSMVFFSSASALPGAKMARVSAYAVAKTAVAVLSLAIAQEEAEAGIRSNVLAPTAIRTAANVLAMGESHAFVERQEIAAAVSYLCSDQSRPMTGQVLHLGSA
jgi:NAD(P)-dependent dehydrogenase (short-subunit alcohol dehydrogenase family)